MKRSKFTDEQIIGILREQEAGAKTAEICRRHGISSATFYAWKSKFGGMFFPDVAPGDSVWWHCDMIHGVEPVEDQQGWGNVMYIPAAPWCAKNEAYADHVRKAFRAGESPYDFPEEHYESSWPDRFRKDELSEVGRRGMGLTD